MSAARGPRPSPRPQGHLRSHIANTWSVGLRMGTSKTRQLPQRGARGSPRGTSSPGCCYSSRATLGPQPENPHPRAQLCPKASAWAARTLLPGTQDPMDVKEKPAWRAGKPVSPSMPPRKSFDMTPTQLRGSPHKAPRSAPPTALTRCHTFSPR